MHWRIELLGGVRVRFGDRVVTRFESRHAAALLARVALFPSRTHPREELAALLWPDADEATGKARLRHVLSSLRRQLVSPGADDIAPFLVDRNNVRLHRDVVSCDVHEFEALLRQGRLVDAGRLYAGDLMPGFYDDWIQDERERLRARFEELEEVEAPPDLPTSRSPDLTPKLPTYLTTFVGRSDERGRLCQSLRHHRLVTLHGSGGCGKTRLALEAARTLADVFERIAFVPLAECPDPGQLAERVRIALQLPAAEGSADERIADVLAGKSALLLLDNVEQLVEGGVGEAVAGLLERLPDLRCLVTSRRLLGVPGEQAFPLDPLPVPAADASEEEIRDSESVALFVERARAMRPDFQVTARNRADLAALCRDLEGMPLALELAASRIRVLSVAEMRQQWSERLSWLIRTGAGQDKKYRQRSLAATLEWSWRLLSPATQRFLASLTVFQGGWSVAAAAWVTQTSDARERLEALAGDALVFGREDAGGHTRFGMLELVRGFAAARLSVSQRQELRARHRAFYQGDVGPDDAANVAAARESAIEEGDAPMAYAIFLAQQDRWATLLGATAALSAAEATLALPAPDLRTRLRALGLAASFADMTGADDRARALAQRGIDEAGSLPELRALALSGRARVGVATYEPEAQVLPWLEESLSLARAAGDRATEGANLRRLGILAMRREDWDAAQTFLSESQALFEALGNELDARYSLANLAQTAQGRGDHDRALTLYEICLTRSRAAGDRIAEGKNLHNIASLQAARGAWSEALEAGRACLRLTYATGNRRTLAFALWNLPEPLLALGEPENATRLMAFAVRFWLERFGTMEARDETDVARFRARVVALVGEERAATLWREGESLTLLEVLEKI